MLLITERKTNQINIPNQTVLRMVSLFVVAYPHEVAEFEKDEYASFLAQVRAEGRMQLDVPEGVTETIEVSRTSKGFLIKASVEVQVEDDVDLLSDKSADKGGMVLVDVKPRQPGKSWNEAQVSFEAFRRFFVVAQGEPTSKGVSCIVNDKAAAVKFLEANGLSFVQ